MRSAFDEDILKGRMVADWIRELKAISDPMVQVQRAKHYYYIVTQYYSNFKRNHPSDRGLIIDQYEGALSVLRGLMDRKTGAHDSIS